MWLKKSCHAQLQVIQWWQRAPTLIKNNCVSFLIHELHSTAFFLGIEILSSASSVNVRANNVVDVTNLWSRIAAVVVGAFDVIIDQYLEKQLWISHNWQSRFDSLNAFPWKATKRKVLMHSQNFKEQPSRSRFWFPRIFNWVWKKC